MARGEAVVDEVVPVAVVVPVAAVVLEVQDLHRQIHQRILLRQNILRRTKRRRAKGVILMMTDHLLCALIPTLRTMLIHGVVGTEGLLQLVVEMDLLLLHHLHPLQTKIQMVFRAGESRLRLMICLKCFVVPIQRNQEKLRLSKSQPFPKTRSSSRPGKVMCEHKLQLQVGKQIKA
jgi:hypothetical protein